jgi:two-component system response regulator
VYSAFNLIAKARTASVGLRQLVECIGRNGCTAFADNQGVKQAMLRQANETILLVEDDEAEVLLIQQAVASCPEDLHLAVASDAAEALEWLTDTVERGYSMPRMILLDLKLPKLAGLAVLRTLRMVRRLQDVPVVVFSKLHEPPDVVLSYQLGANSFVERPANLAEFTRLLRELAQRGWLSGEGLRHSDSQSMPL